MPTKILCKNVYCGFTSNIQTLEIMYVFINMRMDIEIEVYLYSEILLSDKKEPTINTQSNVDKSQQYFVMSKKPDIKEYTH